MRRIPECEGVGETSAESEMFKVAQLRARDTDRTFTFKPTTKDKSFRISPAMRGGIKAGMCKRKKFRWNGDLPMDSAANTSTRIEGG